jgi:hypothetical protein
MILSARGMRSLRRAANQLLDQTCTVYGLASGRPKGRERYPDDYQAVLVNVPCAVLSTRVRPVEMLQGGQPRMTAEFTVSFKAGTAVNAKHIVKVTSLDDRTFRIVGPMTGSYESLRVMQADEIR